MRETKTFTIKGHDHKKWEVRELTAREILTVLSPHSLEGMEWGQVMEHFMSTALPVASTITAEELLDLAPSEIDEIWGHFREVNKTFFGLSDRLGIKGLYQEVRPMALAAFGNYVVGWLQQAMEEHSTTDSDTSSRPSRNGAESRRSGSRTSPTPHGPPRQMTKDGRSSSGTSG